MNAAAPHIISDEAEEKAVILDANEDVVVTIDAISSDTASLLVQPEPRVLQVVNKPRRFMNHTYKDWSEVRPDEGDCFPTAISEMTFAQKVYHILSQPKYSEWIGWMPHGRGFHIKVPLRFESEISEKYFGNRRYSSFLRQLSNHGFRQISEGRDRNTHYHELILRGCPHLTKYMPAPKDARRLIPDPENEPNFYAITHKYPLPGCHISEEDVKEPEAPKPVEKRARSPSPMKPTVEVERPNKRAMLDADLLRNLAAPLRPDLSLYPAVYAMDNNTLLQRALDQSALNRTLQSLMVRNTDPNASLLNQLLMPPQQPNEMALLSAILRQGRP